MLRFGDTLLPGPDAGTLAALAKYQSMVNAKQSYAECVAAAKALFKRYNVKRNHHFKDVRRSLSAMCSGVRRCCYCEDSIADEVEHIQPKDLYPEFVFDWNNYVYACGPCNGPKNNRFSILDGKGELVDITRRQGDPVQPPPAGALAMVNPRHEDPFDFFYLDIGNADGGEGSFMMIESEELDARAVLRAAHSIEILGLNRPTLLMARETAFVAFMSILSDFAVKKRSGAGERTLGRLITGLRNMNHRSVFLEMKRQRTKLPAINALFQAVPESLNW